ncbi:hypothetical protein AB7W88_21000 [Providencia vermicola]|uniref:hypothetical protein n=1 Tax=Providencia TaxID=586 RepID=UPI0018C6FD1E|nr:hypothetical protein [Proteus mirabilis]
MLKPNISISYILFSMFFFPSIVLSKNTSIIDLQLFGDISKYIDTPEATYYAAPSIQYLVRMCNDGAQKGSSNEWSYCLGFLEAAQQYVTKGTGNCPSISLKDILDNIKYQIDKYEEINTTKRWVYDNKNKTKFEVTSLKPNYINPWQQPAFPFITDALIELGCKKPSNTTQ